MGILTLRVLRVLRFDSTNAHHGSDSFSCCEIDSKTSFTQLEHAGVPHRKQYINVLARVVGRLGMLPCFNCFISTKWLAQKMQAGRATGLSIFIQLAESKVKLTTVSLGRKPPQEAAPLITACRQSLFTKGFRVPLYSQQAVFRVLLRPLYLLQN